MPVLHSDTIKLSPTLVNDAITLVNRSGLTSWCEQLYASKRAQHLGGQVARFGFYPLLVGLALVARSEQPMILRNVVRTLNSLTPKQKTRIECPHQVSERMVSKRFNFLARSMDPSEYSEANLIVKQKLTAAEWAKVKNEREAALQHFLSKLITASIPSEYANTGSYAIDASSVPSWARQNATWQQRGLATDPDARWRAHDSTKVPHGNKTSTKADFSSKAWYGYWLHALVRVPEMTVSKKGEVTFSHTPSFIEAMDLTGADTDMAVDGARLVDRMVNQQKNELGADEKVPVSDLLMDRAYSLGYARFLEPIRAHGFKPHLQLRKNQLGLHGQVRGMVIVDGQPYSPSMPTSLYDITPPEAVKPSMADLKAWQEAVDRRTPYAIKLRSIDDNTGQQHWSCPAARDFTAARCTAKPESMSLPASKPTFLGPVGIAPGSANPDICQLQRLRTEAEDLPYWQPYQYGTKLWKLSMGRRARVEGIFGNLKNEATHDMRRGNVRVMGRTKTAIMTAFVCAAVNLRMARLDKIHQRQLAEKEARAAAGEHVGPKTRKPRARTSRIQQVRLERAQHEAAAQAEPVPLK